MGDVRSFSGMAAELPRLIGGPTLRWGIAGPGRIALAFVHALRRHTDQRIVAVGSRSKQRADDVAARTGIPRSWGSYEALVGDPEVDIVYVAVPNGGHRELAELALGAGKHVLVEKPLGVDLDEVHAIRRAAAAAGRFAMEGMWSRFLPQTAVIEQVLANGTLGELEEVRADFGERFDPGIERSVFDPAMGGGALRDIGVYPVWFAQFVLGVPTDVAAAGRLTSSGVDGEARLTLRFPTGAVARLRTTLFEETGTTATILGSAGRLEVDAPFLMPGGLTLVTGSGATRWEDPTPIRALAGLAWEAAAVARHIDQGLLESPEHTLTDTAELIRTLDRAREQIGAP